ncbi:MAG: hypothetical protein EOP84_02890 [Verrucomicrobiaceae bacterium]|nr:MAG: hypothetical protein EOP84_02890 [Verrucomicrobiaceae bacterium]
MAQHKLDIFDVLGGIDRRDFEFLARQDAETRKGFAPPVVLRWASSIKGEAQDYMLLMVNARANPDFYAITDHPELQYRLMASCGLNMRPRHEWIAMPTRARSASALHDFLGTYWPEANDAEIDLLIRQFNRESFEEFVRSCGLAPADEKDALATYDKFHGVKAKGKTDGGKKKAKRA